MTRASSVGPAAEATNAHEAYLATLDAVIAAGQPAGRFVELLNYSVRVARPQLRIPGVAPPLFDLRVAIYRFVELLRKGSDPSDPRWPGLLPQLASAVARLRRHTLTRQATIVAYQPRDALTTDSDHVPCVAAFFYHLRSGVLHSTVVMRSNNAYTYVPHNIFEASLLAEVVAAELGVPMGAMDYTAISVHVEESDVEAARTVLDSSAQPSPAMPPVPREPSPLAQSGELARLAAIARADIDGGGDPARSVKGGERLAPFWRTLFLAYLLRHLDGQAAEDLRTMIVETAREDWLVRLYR